MYVAAVTAEFNPFHNGHAYLAREARRAGATHLVAVMSGNFVQRGAPASFEKRLRTEAALHSGYDLVLELPLPFACAPAERFADGAIQVMTALGCVDALAFGCEDASEALYAAVDALSSPAFDDALHQELGEGTTFAAARQRALAAVAGPKCAMVLRTPNNILGIEYLRAMRRHSFEPSVIGIRRHAVPHDSAAARGCFASASHLRTLLENGEYTAVRHFLPAASFACIGRAGASDEGPCSLYNAERAVLCVLRGLSLERLARLPDLSEGLENRLCSAIRQSTSLEELYALVKSKRYPLARVRRLVLHAFLGLEADLCRTPLPYLRVLGANAAGLQVLSKAKRTAVLPLSVRLSKLAQSSPQARLFAGMEAAATDQYALCSPRLLPCGLEYTRPAVMLK